MNECFICLGETDEKSPCECAAAVHAHCLMLALSKTDVNKCSICKTDLRNVTKQHVTVLNKPAVVITALLATSCLALFAISIAFFVHASSIGGSNVSALHLAASVFLVVSVVAGISLALMARRTAFHLPAVRVRIVSV
tara:strand:+ start:1635 stop:2048 length:414 start_codon:yes stop_codon:yes gene_type:complete